MKIEYNGKEFNKIKELLAETTIANIDKFLFDNEKISLSDFIGLQEKENKIDAEGSASNSGDNGSASNSGNWGSASNSGDNGSASNSGDNGSASNSGNWGSAMSNSFFGKVSNKTGLYAMITEFVFDNLKRGEGVSSHKIVKQNAKLIKFTKKMSGNFYTLFKNKVYQVVEYDGIEMIVLGEKESLNGFEVITGIRFGEDLTMYNKQIKLEEIEKIYVIKKDDITSHGETIKKAIEDFRYKIGNRDLSSFEYLKTTKDTIKTDELIKAYRVITGACEFGTKDFIKNNPDIKDEYTVEEALNFLNSKKADGVGHFEDFIKGEK